MIRSVIILVNNFILDTDSTFTNTSGIQLADQREFVLNNIRDVRSFFICVFT